MYFNFESKHKQNCQLILTHRMIFIRSNTKPWRYRLKLVFHQKIPFLFNYIKNFIWNMLPVNYSDSISKIGLLHKEKRKLNLIKLHHEMRSWECKTSWICRQRYIAKRKFIHLNSYRIYTDFDVKVFTLNICRMRYFGACIRTCIDAMSKL